MVISSLVVETTPDTTARMARRSLGRIDGVEVHESERLQGRRDHRGRDGRRLARQSPAAFIAIEGVIGHQPGVRQLRG